MQQGRRPGAIFQIADPETFAEEIRRAIYMDTAGEPKPIGSLRVAAERIGISAATLNRLYNQKIKSVSESVLDAILALIPARRRVIVWGALVSPKAQELIQGAEASYSAELRAIRRHRTGKRWVGTKGGIRQVDDVPSGKLARAVTGEMALDGLRPRNREVDFLQQLAEHLFPDLYQKFEKAVAASEHSPLRMQLARARVVAPLLEAREAGLLERDWRELEGRDGKWAELRAFVKAGLDRERILLNRAPNIQRAQVIASRPTDFVDPDYTRLSLSTYKLRLKR